MWTWATAARDVLQTTPVLEGVPHFSPNGTFAPHQAVTRGDFNKVLVLTLGLAPNSRRAPSTDVPPSAWYAPYVAAALQAGLVDGVTPTAFEPNGILSREQMAVLVARALKLTATAPLRFSDDGMIAAWALQGVEEAVAGGYLGGFPDGSFQPDGAATRAQAAKVLAMVLKQRQAAATGGGS